MNSLASSPGLVVTPPRLVLAHLFKAGAYATLAMLIGAVAIVQGHAWWTSGRYIETTDDAYVGGEITEIAPHVAGFVAEVLVKDNELVRSGQLLVRIDDREARAAHDQVRALVHERKGIVNSLEAQLARQDADIQRARAELDAREADARFAREDAGRYGRLAVSRASSQQEAERARSASDRAVATVGAARAEMNSEIEQRRVLESRIAAARDGIAQAQAALRTAAIDLGYTEIFSPIDGYVGNRAVRPGAHVSTGTYLLSIVPAHGLWVDANFKEDQIGGMRPGQAATVVADTFPELKMRGHIQSLAPATGATFSVIPAENATGNFTKIVRRVPVRIVLDGRDGELGVLRPGLSTVVSIDLRGRPGAGS